MTKKVVSKVKDINSSFKDSLTSNKFTQGYSYNNCPIQTTLIIFEHFISF